MKRIIIYFRLVLLTVFLITCSKYNAYSQGTDISSGTHLGLYVGLSMGPSQSTIINEGSSSVANIISTKKNSFFGSVEFGYFLSKNLGLSSGIGFTSYKSQITLDSYQSNFNTVDSDNEAYERRVSASGIKELQAIGFLSIPLCLNLRLPFGSVAGFFVQGGANITVPMSKSYESTGKFTYKGYYSTYNILLENLPDFDFPSDLDSKSDGELEVKPFNLSLIASAGFDFSISEKIQLALAVTYDKSLSSISQYSTTQDFQLSSSTNEINSLMEGSSTAKTQLMGVKIMFRYYFR
jgi:hypothetical protein